MKRSPSSVTHRRCYPAYSTESQYDKCTVVPVFKDHPWDQENVVLYLGGLKIKVI